MGGLRATCSVVLGVIVGKSGFVNAGGGTANLAASALRASELQSKTSLIAQDEAVLQSGVSKLNAALGKHQYAQAKVFAQFVVEVLNDVLGEAGESTIHAAETEAGTLAEIGSSLVVGSAAAAESTGSSVKQQQQQPQSDSHSHAHDDPIHKAPGSRAEAVPANLASADSDELPSSEVLNAGTELRKKLRLLITRLQNNLSTAVENQDFKLASTIRAELEVAQKQYDSPLQDASLSLQSSSSASSSASLPPSSASDPAAGSVPSALRGGSDTAAVSGAAVDQQQNFQVDQTETKPDEKQVSEEQVQEAQNALRAQMIDALQSEDFALADELRSKMLSAGLLPAIAGQSPH